LTRPYLGLLAFDAAVSWASFPSQNEKKTREPSTSFDRTRERKTVREMQASLSNQGNPASPTRAFGDRRKEVELKDQLVEAHDSISIDKFSILEAELEESRKEAAEREEDLQAHFEESQMQAADRVKALQALLVAKDRENGKLKEKNKELVEKADDLKEEIRKTEDFLNKSYNDTLEGLTTHIQEMTGQVNELNTENDRLAFQHSEAQRVCKFLEDKMAAVEEEKETIVSRFKFQLTESHRITSFLESKLLETQDELTKLNATHVGDEIAMENKQLKQKVVDLKKEIRSTEDTLNKSYNETLEGLTGHIEEMEKQIEDFADENDRLIFQHTEAQRVCKFYEEKVESMELNKSQELASAQFSLSESQRVTKFLANKIETKETEKDKLIASLQFSLAEGQRVRNFMEAKLNSHHEDKVAACRVLEDQIDDLNLEVTSKMILLEAHQEQYHAKAIAMRQVTNHLEEVEGKLETSKMMSEFLESKLASSKMALKQRGPDPASFAEIEHLKARAKEVKATIELLSEGFTTARVQHSSMSGQIDMLERKVTKVSVNLDSKVEALNATQRALERERKKTAELYEEVREIELEHAKTKEQLQLAKAEKKALATKMQGRPSLIHGKVSHFV
jgi:chromosome segregation ATPase